MSKQRGKPNALKHGANAEVVLLWGEKYEDYESLQAGSFKEYYPDGPSEEYLVQALVDLVWRRRRVVRYDELKMQKRLNEIRKQNEISRDRANLIALASSFKELTSAEEVEAKLATLSPLYRAVIRTKWPLAKDGDGKEWAAKIAKGLDEWENQDICEEADEFIRAVESESIVLDLLRLERIDAQIESTFKRLVQTKTTKQALQRLQPKLITISTPNKPAEENKPDESKS